MHAVVISVIQQRARSDHLHIHAALFRKYDGLEEIIKKEVLQNIKQEQECLKLKHKYHGTEM